MSGVIIKAGQTDYAKKQNGIINGAYMAKAIVINR